MRRELTGKPLSRPYCKKGVHFSHSYSPCSCYALQPVGVFGQL